MTGSGLILHHYPRSPYAEKVRLALGLKGLEYRAVIVPSWMPKPGLTPLTGGYRRTPIMQCGADVYCDTLLILEEIERRHPTPTLFPDGAQALATALGWGIEKSVFIPAVGVIAGLTGQAYPRELVDDRGPFFGFSLEHAPMLAKQPVFVDRLNAHLAWLARLLHDGLLHDGRPFLLGQAPGAADLAAYHPLWHLRRAGGDPAAAQAVLTLLPRLPDLLPWMDRVAAIGHGTPHEIAAADALAEARHATPAPVEPGLPFAALHGIEPGSEVTMTPDDSGRDPVQGRLLAVTETRVVLRRTDLALGEINVHFPRAGFDAAAA